MPSQGDNFELDAMISETIHARTFASMSFSLGSNKRPFFDWQNFWAFSQSILSFVSWRRHISPIPFQPSGHPVVCEISSILCLHELCDVSQLKLPSYCSISTARTLKKANDAMAHAWHTTLKLNFAILFFRVGTDKQDRNELNSRAH